MITFPSYGAAAMPRFKLVPSPHILFRYHAQPSMTVWAANHSYKTEQPQVLKPKVHDFYDKRDPNTLWWRVAAQRLKLKKVVRNHHARRLRKIFREVLYQNGYDENGRPVPQEKLPEGLPLRETPLRGTLDIEPLETVVTEDDTQVRATMSRLLDGVMRLKEEWPKEPSTDTDQKATQQVS